ncbi:PTS mannose transporter subunit IID [Atopobium sp. HMSC064B08]|nr:PTS mannose transporter subunit IID [Atopobium sp. HMSC064B08]
MGKIDKKTLNKVLLRTQACQFAHNYERMQSLSLTYCFTPVLEKLYKDAPKEERINAMKRHLEYFNTHPLAIPFILGISAALEESTEEDQKDTVVGIKTSLMGPFAGLGDSLLNLTWYPIAGSIGASLCVNDGSIIGPLVMFLMINLLYWPLKYFGLHKGYEMGMDLVEKAGMSVFNRLGNLANVLGVMVTGGLIATTVKLKLALQFAFGDGDPLVLQDKLDGIFPFLFPCILTFVCYKLLKKGQGKNSAQIIIGLIAVALVFAAIGYYFPVFNIFA